MGKWKPSKTAKREFAQKMQDIELFCLQNNIVASTTKDSYYFTVRGQKYRVSNHSIEASNAGAYNWAGEKVRDLYHEAGREKDVIYIHAGKTRIMDIYNDLMLGYKLNGKGERV